MKFFSFLFSCILLPFVSAKFFENEIEIISPCDGSVKFNFWKHNQQFLFKANEPLYLQKWYVKIEKVIVEMDCIPNFTAMFNFRGNINDKLIVSDSNWKCDNVPAQIFTKKNDFWVPSYVFQNFDMLISYWIGLNTLSKLQCIITPDNYIDSVMTTIPDMESSAPIPSPLTLSPTFVEKENSYTQNPTIMITKSPSSILPPIPTTAPITPSPTPS